MATSDLGHQLTDKELAKLERRIAKLYREAGKELQETIDAYFEQFKKRDEEMKALIGTVQNGKEWTEADYKNWRLNQIGRGERYQAMRDKVAHRVTDANAVAVSYTNDATPGIYSLNRNYAAYTVESVAGDVGFDLWDEQTVKRLIVEQPGLMPYYPKDKALKRGIDLAYGKKQITASVTSSILQGLSIKHMADNLQKRITTMSRDSAIRTARTAVTGAQNAGRMDSYAAAEKMGIKLKKQWRRWTAERDTLMPCWTVKRWALISRSKSMVMTSCSPVILLHLATSCIIAVARWLRTLVELIPRDKDAPEIRLQAKTRSFQI